MCVTLMRRWRTIPQKKGRESRVNRRKEFIVLSWAGLGIILLTLAFVWDGDSVQAQPVTHGFHAITPGISQDDKQTGETQLWFDILKHINDGYAHFKFYNVGPNPCSITDIYIQDGQLCSLLYIVDKDDPVGGPYGDPGVDFSIGATPGNLPDGQYADPPFTATKRFSSDSDPPIQPNGIEAGEWLEAVYSIDPSKTVYDIDAEIDAGLLRIGYHVQSFDDGKSAAFVNNTEGIPEPTTALLLGLGGLALLKKYKKYKNKC